MIHQGIWRNLSNGQYYLVTGTRINCTDNNKIMVDYEDNNGTKYTRALDEFITKFEAVQII